MYAVIFRAQTGQLDNSYHEMAELLRKLAMEKYGCTEFTSITDGDTEIAVSYWDDEKQIRLWKEDSEHIVAQELGKAGWYQNYQVQVVKIMREYSSD